MRPLRLVSSLLLLGLSACDQGDGQASKLAGLKDRAKAEAEKLSALSKDAAEALKFTHDGMMEIHALISANDYEKARELAAKVDAFLSSRSLSWYVQILATEELKGLAAARTQIAELQKTSDLTPVEKASLDVLAKGFHNKNFKSLDLPMLLAALAIDAKLGGSGGGKLFIMFQQNLRPYDAEAIDMRSWVEGGEPETQEVFRAKFGASWFDSFNPTSELQTGDSSKSPSSQTK